MNNYLEKIHEHEIAVLREEISVLKEEIAMMREKTLKEVAAKLAKANIANPVIRKVIDLPEKELTSILY